jgi:hypothetical protein
LAVGLVHKGGCAEVKLVWVRKKGPPDDPEEEEGEGMMSDNGEE